MNHSSAASELMSVLEAASQAELTLESWVDPCKLVRVRTLRPGCVGSETALYSQFRL
ncbi:hypothetical protein F511_17735 [Dorcoceras hygrometricum]|uniref:Uncharacterized protein n=1 Tax=Dorcoceras hygrometricum TaxID=472368 RepID=A0A2Z7B5F9_9LAMI|nr:hypothetical protein F511_17735 [Dorcoceras hygrometricum]